MIPFLLGFVHRLRKKAPSLIKSRGTSSSCFTCSDISMGEDEVENLANVEEFWKHPAEKWRAMGLGSK